MSPLPQFLLLAAIEVAGLFAIWFLIRSRVRRYLELENLLGGVREEARALVMELNETADRNVSLVEDRMHALHDLLDELDRRIGVERKTLANRDSEREVYARLNKRRPIVPSEAGERSLLAEQAQPAVQQAAVQQQALPQAAQPPSQAAKLSGTDAPITLNLGSQQRSPDPAAAQDGMAPPRFDLAEQPLVPAHSKRDVALDLYRRGFSADLIAARTGATVAEIELLVELEERRAAGKGSSA